MRRAALVILCTWLAAILVGMLARACAPPTPRLRDLPPETTR